MIHCNRLCMTTARSKLKWEGKNISQTNSKRDKPSKHFWWVAGTFSSSRNACIIWNMSPTLSLHHRKWNWIFFASSLARLLCNKRSETRKFSHCPPLLNDIIFKFVFTFLASSLYNLHNGWFNLPLSFFSKQWETHFASLFEKEEKLAN